MQLSKIERKKGVFVQEASPKEGWLSGWVWAGARDVQRDAAGGCAQPIEEKAQGDLTAGCNHLNEKV